MSSGAALLRRVHKIEKQFNPPREPRQWLVQLEEGEEVSDELMAQLGTYDTLAVRRFPKNYLTGGSLVGHNPETGQLMSCWVNVGGGRKKPCVVHEYGVDMHLV